MHCPSRRITFRCVSRTTDNGLLFVWMDKCVLCPSLYLRRMTRRTTNVCPSLSRRIMRLLVQQRPFIRPDGERQLSLDCLIFTLLKTRCKKWKSIAIEWKYKTCNPTSLCIAALKRNKSNISNSKSLHMLMEQAQNTWYKSMLLCGMKRLTR